MRLFYLLLICLFGSALGYAQPIYEVKRGKVSFHSEAPQELISAESADVKGVVDISKKAFAFKISIPSFLGFNSPLQREHFNENYMESNIFPEATFRGKVIEDIDYTKEGVYTVRAKGKLSIHGIEKERIIKSQITIKSGSMRIKSDFTVLLSDHDIKIPRVVSEKLAQEIQVSLTADLKPAR